MAPTSKIKILIGSAALLIGCCWYLMKPDKASEGDESSDAESAAAYSLRLDSPERSWQSFCGLPEGSQIISSKIVPHEGSDGRELLEITLADDAATALRYSADHFTVSSAAPGGLEMAKSLLRRTGAVLTPMPAGSRLIRVELGARDFQGIIGELTASQELVGSYATVELDGLAMGGAVPDPNDPYYANQWHHPEIGMPDAWEISQGSAGVTVAVIDTGVRTSLNDFTGRHVAGYDFANDDSDPIDDHGHGTIVATILAANANNSIGVTGIDWNCQIMPIKALNENNTGFISNITLGVDYAVDAGVDIINLSLGAQIENTGLAAAVARAVAADILVVSISHNDGINSIAMPGNLPGVLTVGATEQDGTKSAFSNWGPELDLVAPGRQMVGINDEAQVVAQWGTSVAAPQVSGAAALIKAVGANYSSEDIKHLIRAGATDQAGDANDTAGYDEYYGWGKLQVYHTLSLAASQTSIEMLGDGNVSIKWDVLETLQSRDIFDIYWSADQTNWTAIDSPSISFEGAEATWTDDGSITGVAPASAEKRFYQVKVRTP